MKTRKYLAIVLSMLMILSACNCFATAIDVEEEAEASLMEVTPVRIKITNANNTQQGCTTEDCTDLLGRYAQKIIPRDQTASVAPAYFASTTAEKNPAFRVVKVVYYSEYDATTLPTPTMSLWATGFVGKSGVTAEFDTAPTKNAWNTVYIDIGKSNFATSDYLDAFMFKPYAGNPQGTARTLIGYIGLFDTMANAKAHVSEYEGELAITGINIGTEALSGFDPATTEYEVSLNGASSLPEITLTGTGNDYGLTIEKSDYNYATGTATATVKKNGTTLYTINFTGGAMSTNIAPVALAVNYAGAAAQRCTTEAVSDEFGRSMIKINPVKQYYENGSDKTATGNIFPGGETPAAKTNDYHVVKLVYKSTDTHIPTFKFYHLDEGKSDAVLNPIYDTAPTTDGWNTIYFDYTGRGRLKMYQIALSNDDVGNHLDDDYRIGYFGAFANLVDARLHNSAFEGEFDYTDVKLDGESIGKVSTYTYDLEGTNLIPRLTIVATGNTDSVAITNGVMAENGTATSTVTNNGTPIVTINYVNGSNEFGINAISYNGVAIEGFDRAVTSYSVELPFASPQPVVAFSHFGALPATVGVEYETVAAGYKAYIKNGAETLYTVTFNVDQIKPTGLLNTLYKLNADKDIKVGYFGGSVTSGTGATNGNNKSWRGLTREWIKATFPEATVTEINDAIGGTGVIYGLFRATDRYFAKNGGVAPDLNFIEMAINDAYDGVSGDIQYVYIESLIKKIYASNPKADIVFVITGDSGCASAEVASATPVFGKAYTDLAEYYNIPIIYVFRELALTMAQENGGNAVTATSHDIWKKYFQRPDSSVDGVHPNDTGYAHYASTIISYLEQQLPVGYTPEASEYADKAQPATPYCEQNAKGTLLPDARLINPADIVTNSALGGFSVTSSSSYNVLRSTKKDDVVSLTFNGKNLGIWTWSYGTKNSINGTNITYSIDGGAPQTANIYRSYPNHKCYILAENLSDGEHTIRFLHTDAYAAFDIYYFLIWGLNGAEPAMSAVPYFTKEAMSAIDPVTNEPVVNVTVSGATGIDSVFNFDPNVNRYSIPVEIAENGNATISLMSAITYPALNLDIPEGYYGYSFYQAGEGGNPENVASLVIDNVETYLFEFVLQGVPEGYTVTKAVTPFGNDAKITFASPTEKNLQIKKVNDADDAWVNYNAGITEITGLNAGLYEMRYVEGENFGATVEARIWETYPANANVMYFKDGASGDGRTPENPASSAKKLPSIFTNFKARFPTEALDESRVNYIVFVDAVTNTSGSDLISTDGWADIVITAEYGAKFYMQSSTKHARLADVAGTAKMTWKNIDVVLGNPAAADDKMNGEIYYSAYGNEVVLDEFNIVDYAVNANGIKRTTGIYIHVFGDGGGTYTVNNAKTFTIDCSNINIAMTRASGFNDCYVTGDVPGVILKNGTVSEFGFGGHGKNAKNVGVNRGVIDGGNVKTAAYVGACSNGGIIGSAILVVNGGTIAKIDAKASTTLDKVLIINNGLSYPVTTTNLTHYIKSGVGGKADATFGEDDRVASFTFATDKAYVFIDKGTANQKKLTVVDGTASISATEMGTGEHSVVYANSEFVVTFNKGENNYATVPAMIENNGEAIATLADPTFNNGAKYTFRGWSADGTNIVTLPYTPAGDAELTALWDIDQGVFWVSDISGYEDGGDDPSYPLGGKANFLNAGTYNVVKVASNNYKDKYGDLKIFELLAENVRGYTLKNINDYAVYSKLSLTMAYDKNKTLGEYTFIVTDSAVLRHPNATGKINIVGMDKNNSSLIMFGSSNSAGAGGVKLSNITISNVSTGETYIITGGNPYEIASDVVSMGGNMLMDGKTYVRKGRRHYGNEELCYNATGGAHTDGVLVALEDVIEGKEYIYPKGATPRIAIANYSAAPMMNSNFILSGGNYYLVATGAGYNLTTAAGLANAVNGTKTLTVNGGTIDTIATSHMGYTNGTSIYTINDGTITTVKLGHNQANTDANSRGSTYGLVYAKINGGKITTVQTQANLNGGEAPEDAPDANGNYSVTINKDLKSYKQMGVTVAEINGGTVGTISGADTSKATRVVILNNGISTTISGDAYEYLVRNAAVDAHVGAEVDTSATIEISGTTYPLGEKYTFTGFKVESSNPAYTRVLLKKTSGEPVMTYELTDGEVIIPKSDMTPKTDYSIELLSVDEKITVAGKLYVEREPDHAPTTGNYARLSVYDASDNTLLTSVDLEQASTRTVAEQTTVGEHTVIEHYLTYSSEILATALGTATDVYFVIEKNGYVAHTSANYAVATSIGETLTLDVKLKSGDIKDSFEDFCGDGVVDIDDFIRVIRSFSTEIQTSAIAQQYAQAVDVNEDGVVSIEDISIVKTGMN